MEGLVYTGLLLLLPVITAYTEFDCTSVNAPHIGCQVYHGTSNDCRPDELQARFSHLYNDGLEYPEKPYDFTVDISYIHYPQYHDASYPAFNITVRPPITSSYKDVKGFEITYMELIAGNTEVKCIIFNLTGEITTTDKENKVAFTSELVGPVASGKDFFLMAYSLPKPAAHYDKDMSIATMVHTGPPFNTTSPSAASWTAVISYRNFSREIYYSFQPPPSRFNFQYFIVSLYNVSDDKEIYGPLVGRKNTTEFSGVFTDLKSGWYRLKIFPEDIYFQDHEKCLCKNSRDLCVTCITTRTGAMYIHEPPSTTPSPTTTHQPVLPTTKSSTSSGKRMSNSPSSFPIAQIIS